MKELTLLQLLTRGQPADPSKSSYPSQRSCRGVGLASTAPACNPHPSTASAPQGVPEAAAARTRRRCTLQGSRSQGRRPTRRLVRSTMADARTPAEAHPRVPDEASGSALLGSAAGALKCSSIVDCWLNSESSEDEVGPPSGPWPWGVRGDARAPA